MFRKKTNQRQTKNQPIRRSQVTTYYRREGNEGPSPFSRKTAKKRVRRYVFGVLDIFLGAIVILVLIYSLLVKPDPKLIASSLAYHSLADYQRAAAAQIGQFANRNKITFNEQAVAQQLQKQFPEINDVQIELPILSERPIIRLSVSNTSFYLNSHGSRFIVDADGKAVAKATALPNNKLVVVDDQSGFADRVGLQILSADSVTFINNLVAQCRRASVPVSSLTLPNVPQELDLRTKDQTYFVKFYLDGDVLDQTGQFLAARKHFAQTNLPPSQYLDVRVPGKIFYK